MSRYAALLALLMAARLQLCAAAPAQRLRYDGWKVVAVTLRDPADVERMLDISPLFLACEPRVGCQPWAVAPERFPLLLESGLTCSVLHDDLQQLLDREAGWQQRGSVSDFYDAYRTYEEIVARIDALVAACPDLAARLDIGTSIEGRPVCGLIVTSPVGTGKPALFFNAGHHAREWIGPMSTLYLAEQLILRYHSDPQVHALLDSLVFYIVPVVNPDGYAFTWSTDRMWRKNRRDNGDGSFGVDLNRNWPLGWGGPGSSHNPGSDIYCGSAPFSEPENVNLRDFILSHPDIIAHIDFHSYGQWLLYPYAYDYVLPPEPDAARFADLGSHMARAIADVWGAEYVTQPAFDLYLAGGVMSDWVYDEPGIFSWSVELRPAPGSFYGFILPADGITLTGAEIFAAITFMAQYLTQPLVISFPQGLPPAVVPDQPATVPVRIAESCATLDPNSPTLVYRVGGSGPFMQQSLTPLGGDEYQATLPAAPCGSQIQYYFRADAFRTRVNSPQDAPGSLYLTDATLRVRFADDMETERGWTVGAADDDAIAGIWTRMDPEGTVYRGQQIQPEDDHSPAGTLCWVTDGRAGTDAFTYKVTGGKTTLLSPVLDLTGAQDPLISYWYWYCNNALLRPPDDVFTVDVSSDAGQTWANVQTLGPEGLRTDGLWYYHEFRVADFVALTDQVVVRFVASDYGPSSLVEAAVDDLRVVSFECSSQCFGDLNGDGARNLTDLAALLTHYGTAGGASYEDGDLDGDGDVDLPDLAALLTVYGLDCQ